MKLTWLGQAGYLLESNSGIRIMIDPYLSDRLYERNGDVFFRQVPVREEYLDIQLDALILTHCHEDHTDPSTLVRLLANKEPMCVLAPINTWRDIRGTYAGGHNYIQFDRGIQWTLGDVVLKAVFAAHTDAHAIGVIIEADGKVVYHTGDTLYHREIPTWLESKVDVLILPINGQGCNMNCADAHKLARLLQPKTVLPMHFDMFRKLGCDAKAFTSLCTEDEFLVLIPEHYVPVEI